MHARRRTGVDSNTYADPVTPTFCLACTTLNKHCVSTERETDAEVCGKVPFAYTRHIYKDQPPKSWSLQLLNIPPHSGNLHSADHLPPLLCLHSLGTNTKLSQGHLQECLGQQFFPNSQIASSVTACLTFTHTQS